MDAVEHRPGRPIPFREHEYVACAERINRLLKLGTVPDILTRRLFAKDLVAALRAQRGDLPVEMLVGCRHPGVADSSHFISHRFVDHRNMPEILHFQIFATAEAAADA